ncbi:MAG: hypothetical protein H6736_03340 [Alphaproteobacteria bacterium]|nr:hypothetical protein [Alphaproteobacteria bacterium]
MEERLLPVLRRVTAPVGAEIAAHEDPASALVTRVLPTTGGWLRAALVEDREHDVRYVQRRDLEQAGLASADAWRLALGNLGHRAHEPAVPIEGGVEVRAWGGFASSLVLLGGWWRTVSERVDGDPIALAPDVDRLVVIGSEHPELPRWLGWAFDTFRTTSRPLSPAPLHAPGRAPRNLALLQAFTYAEQDEVLLETAPEGVYVAGLALHLGADGSARTRTRVEPGHPCWLPEADEVETPAGTVTLGSLDLPRVPELWPPRRLWS